MERVVTYLDSAVNVLLLDNGVGSLGLSEPEKKFRTKFLAGRPPVFIQHTFATIVYAQINNDSNVLILVTANFAAIW